MSRLAQISFSPKQLLAMLLAGCLLIAGLSFGSYRLSDKTLTGRQGALSFIDRDCRLAFVQQRRLIGVGAGGSFILIGTGWVVVAQLAQTWQRQRNRELAENAVLLCLSPRVDERSKWPAAAELWAALHSSLARPGWQVWLGAGLHLSFEVVQVAGERLAFYVWTPRPVADMVVRQLRAVYAGLEVETLAKSGPDGVPTAAIDDYLEQVSPKAVWSWADLGLARESWRPLRTDFAGDPLPSLLSTLEGLASGHELAAVHVIVRPAAGGWQQGGARFIGTLRGDNTPQGQPRPRLGTQDRTLIKQIELKSQARGYELCLRVMVAGQGEGEGSPSTALRTSLERLVRIYDQFAAGNALAVRTGGDQQALYRLKGRFLPAGWGRSVVGEPELAAIAHLPNQELTGVALTRARARMERPSPVSFVGPNEQRLVLGRFADVPTFNGQLTPSSYPLAPVRRWLKLAGDEIDGADPALADDALDRQVGIKLLDARRHFHVIGPTGVGKSTMLLRMIWQYLTYFPDAAVWLQEPHQDLTHKVIQRVPLWREKDIIWLDVMDPERVIGINPMEFVPGADLGQVVADVMGVMRKAMGASWETAVQMQEILENALLAVISGEPRPTLVHLFKLLTEADYRYDLTYNLQDPIAAPYWASLEQRKEKELDVMFSVPRRRINAFLRNPIVRRIVAQGVSTVNFRQAIDEGKVILVQLDGRMGASNRVFVGAMMMYKLFGAVMSRMDIPEAQRRQVAICVDEFQTFVGQSGHA